MQLDVVDQLIIVAEGVQQLLLVKVLFVHAELWNYMPTTSTDY